MKWVIGLLATLALAIAVLLILRLPYETAIRFGGYSATAAFAALVGLFLRWRAGRVQRNRRTG